MNKIIITINLLIIFCISQVAGAYSFNDDNISNFLSESISVNALKDTIEFYNNNQKSIINKRYISIIDYSLSAEVKRFYILDLKTGDVQKEFVSHAKKSDSNLDQYLDTCQNAVDNKKNMTRAGFMLVSNPYRSYN